MKKVLLVFGSLILALVLTYILIGYSTGWGSSEDRELVYTYLIPEDFTGCAWIRYGQPGAKPLEITNDEVIFKIPENGILHTSTDYDSVAYVYTTKVFSVNEQGEPIKQLINEYDLPPSTGYQFDDQNPGDVTSINFDSSEEGCRFIEGVSN
ncbi:DUF6843 domain-containing protein [Planococcus shenhongbingii]|uniref:DUF6843 domain-containing protein n=1 Tax=Planococcus shenhongbingii TaxID=3058398 RepID=A0ABT8NCN9_9BACL|nr:hypothetical protein [Planococcus sp. N017]MDN7245641.1 hypothetical protein [Planococcus sp. N017]